MWSLKRDMKLAAETWKQILSVYGEQAEEPPKVLRHSVLVEAHFHVRLSQEEIAKSCFRISGKLTPDGKLNQQFPLLVSKMSRFV